MKGAEDMHQGYFGILRFNIQPLSCTISLAL